MVSRTLLISLLCAGLFACGAPVTRQPAPAPEPPTVPGGDVPPTGAGASLLDEAERARRAGEPRRAENLLRRAQRFDARNPRVYLELARLYRQRGDEDAARTMAQRGLLYCARDGCAELREMAD